MKHDWERLADDLKKVCEHGWEPMRRCRNCGKVQKRVSETAWMRVTGYTWHPLAGRCKPSETHTSTVKVRSKN